MKGGRRTRKNYGHADGILHVRYGFATDFHANRQIFLQNACLT